jgi:hypothetical protein
VPVDPVRASAEIEQQLRAIGTPERAAGEKRYLKSQLDHLGATVWQNRCTIRGFVKQHSDLTHAELVAVSGALWSSGIFDCRLAAGLLLDLLKRTAPVNRAPLRVDAHRRLGENPRNRTRRIKMALTAQAAHSGSR